MNVSKGWIIFLVLAGILLTAKATAFFLSSPSSFTSDNIIVIPVYGSLMIDQSDGIIDTQTVVADELIQELKEAEEDQSVKAIVLEINSPGGSAVASAEIAETLKTLSKPTYSIIRDAGASGAYWIASATDKIYASPMSITGSVGVISSYLEFSGLMDKYGVHYQRLVAGKYKDIGTPYKDLTPEERSILENKLERIHTIFINEVAANRHLSEKNIPTISTGAFFLGLEAKDLGLVDELATKEQALEKIKQELQAPHASVIEKKKSRSFFQSLVKQLPLSFGQGFARELLSTQAQEKIEIRASNS